MTKSDGSRRQPTSDARSGRIRLFVADSEALFGDALGVALADYGGFEVCGHQPTEGPKAAEEAVAQGVDVALLDYWLMNMEGPAVTVAIRARAPETRVILLSWFHGPREVHYAMAAGASGLLPKSMSLDDVAHSIRQVHEGKGPVIAPGLEKMLAQRGDAHRRAARVWERIRSLTPRELEILMLLGDDLRTADIAARLGLSVATVRLHVHHILRKTGARSQFAAVALARRYGLVRP